jgi:hypothetical protein
VIEVASNTPISDMNRLFIGLCEHTVTFPNLPQNDASPGDGIQYINPSQLIVYLPPGEEIVQILSSQSGGILTPENPSSDMRRRMHVGRPSGTHFKHGGACKITCRRLL